MITSPKIEELAFKGVCKWKVFWIGYNSVATIPCPNGGFLLLRNITWSPFTQGNTRNIQLLNCAHQLSIVEQGSKEELIYLFRDPLAQITEVNGIGAAHSIPSTAQQNIETWAVYKQNINIDILTIPTVDPANFGAAAALNPIGQERTIPLGYGATPLLSNYLIAAGENYYSTGQKRPFLGIAFAGAGIKDNLRYDYRLARQIQLPGATDIDRQYQFPIIGFGYWEFSIPVSEYLNQ